MRELIVLCPAGSCIPMRAAAFQAAAARSIGGSTLDGAIPAIGPVGALFVDDGPVRLHEAVDLVRRVRHGRGDLRCELRILVDRPPALSSCRPPPTLRPPPA